MDSQSKWTDDKSHLDTQRPERVNSAYRKKPCRLVFLSLRSYRWVFALAFGYAILVFVLSLMNLPTSGLDAPTHSELRIDDTRVTLLIWWRPFGNRDPLPDCAVRYGIQDCTVITKRSTRTPVQMLLLYTTANWCSTGTRSPVLLGLRVRNGSGWTLSLRVTPALWLGWMEYLTLPCHTAEAQTSFCPMGTYSPGEETKTPHRWVCGTGAEWSRG